MVSAVKAESDASRHVWFSDSVTEEARNYSDQFVYNPYTNFLEVS